MAGDPRALLDQADKMLASAGKGFSFFGGNKEDKYQQAADLYSQAAYAFRMQKMYNESGQAFEKAADVQSSKLNEPADAANTYVDAFKVYKQDNPKKAVQCLNYSIDSYCKTGNFRRAAQHKENAGETLEQMGEMKEALSYYEIAAGWYDDDNAGALANKLWLKVADISALEGDYHKAAKIYGDIAKKSIDNNLMRYSVKNYLLKAGICQLGSGDLISAKRGLEEATALDPTFAATREYQLLEEITTAVEANDQEKFEDSLFKFDQIQKLDNWQTKLLLRIKNSTFEPEDFS